MPLYDYGCSRCKKEWDSLNSIKERKKEICSCGQQAELKVLGSNVNVGDFYNGKYDEGLGCKIESKQHKRQLLKENNLVEVG